MLSAMLHHQCPSGINRLSASCKVDSLLGSREVADITGDARVHDGEDAGVVGGQGAPSSANIGGRPSDMRRTGAPLQVRM